MCSKSERWFHNHHKLAIFETIGSFQFQLELAIACYTGLCAKLYKAQEGEKSN